MRTVVGLAALGLALAGCDTLFPEFAGGNKPVVDMAASDMGGDMNPNPHLAGQVCTLADLRDYRSCTFGVPGVLRITIEESRDSGMTDANGVFDIALARGLTGITVAVVDPSGQLAPTIVPLTLVSGALDKVALPAVPASSLQAAASANALTPDPNLGSVLAWAIDNTGAPVASVSSDRTMLVDGPAPNQLFFGTNTGSRGAIGLINASPQNVTIALTPPPTTIVKGDRFAIPVRAGAVTATRLELLPR